MKIFKYHKLFLAILFLLPTVSFAQEKDVVIRIIQDEYASRLDDFNTNITLKKKPFKFQLLLDDVEGVYVFASIRDSVYRFTENSPIRDFPYLNLLELRDADKFNLNKELNLSETGWSYWFYKDSADWHSFSRKVVGMGDKGTICTKTIKQLYDVPAETVIKLRTINTPLYLLFVAVKEYDAAGNPKTELLRRKVKIDWTDAE